MIAAPRTRSCGRRADYDAIVIGSGVGGSVTAGLLARDGARVLVVEKNRELGGVLASYRRDGYKLDFGSHLISRGDRGPLAHALRLAGATDVTFLTHPIPVRSRGMFEITAPAHRGGLAATALEAARTLELSTAERAHLARMVFQLFTLTEWELRRWDRRTLDEFVRSHTEHPGAYFLFSFLASIFFVLPPWQVSAGEAIRCLRGVLASYRLSYVAGGMDSIAHALLRIVDGADGDLVIGRRAIAIRRRARSLVVTTSDGAEYTAPIVACNLAPADALALVEDDVPDDYRARVAAIRGSGNAHQVKLALRRPLVEEGCLIGGVSLAGKTLHDLSIPLMHDTVDAIDAGRVSDPLAIYAPVPTNYDPTLGPGQLIVASIYGPTRDDPADPPARWRERSMAALRQVIPHLDDELVFAEFTPIRAVAGWMGKSNRGAICNGQFPGQVGRDRLPVTTPIPGLYLVGDGAGGRGIGTELAASSALEAVDAMYEAAARRAA
ncbi:MAG TPA: NAD(P)/FAD-dependent oxidoreductase [Kofleriaceae bacterium]|nr:NAD(P)/FAD-dependent oxidoreductase [Kofleriaceae bacterium]